MSSVAIMIFGKSANTSPRAFNSSNEYAAPEGFDGLLIKINRVFFSTAFPLERILFNYYKIGAVAKNCAIQ